MGCNYLSLPEILASGNKVYIWSTMNLDSVSIWIPFFLSHKAKMVLWWVYNSLQTTCRWVSARKTKIQCVSSGVTSFFHWCISVKGLIEGQSFSLRGNEKTHMRFENTKVLKPQPLFNSSTISWWHFNMPLWTKSHHMMTYMKCPNPPTPAGYYLIYLLWGPEREG